jgi:hypothetical protein
MGLPLFISIDTIVIPRFTAQQNPFYIIFT